MKIKNKKTKIIIYSASTLIGLIAGFVYYKTIGCNTGSCTIKSSPILSSCFGGILGFLISNIFA